MKYGVALLANSFATGAVAAALFGRWLLGPMKENEMDRIEQIGTDD